MSGVSLQCGDCGALLKSVEEAQQHAELTSHSNFSKSTEPVLNLVCSSCGKPYRSKTGFRFLELSFSSSFAAMGRIEQVMDAMHVPIVFDKYEVHGDMKKIREGVLESIRENKVCIKGGLMTPIGGGVSSLNVHLRKELDLYASLVHCFNVKGIQTRHDNVDIVVIRENSGGEYAGLEHEVVHGVVESLKVMTKFCSEHVAKYAFEYAYLNNRKKVIDVHKANIMKLADRLFLESCREMAIQYPTIEYNEIIVDNCCMQLVSKPEQFDVMVTPNLYGNLVSNVAAGIAGGTGVMPGSIVL